MSTSAVASLTEIALDLTEEERILVLHVDDELGSLKVAKQCLEMQGPFQVETASSVEEALKKLKEKTFDAIVSDYQMPEKDGLQLLKEVRGNGNDIPFILFTGKGREEVAIKALNYGADQYINKIGLPKTVYTQLAHGIRQAVERKRASEEVWKREQRLRAILASSPDIISVSDLQGNIVDCNEAAWKLTGFSSKEELLGKSSFEFIAEKDRERAMENLKKTLEQGAVRNIEYTLRKKDGEEYIGELSVSTLKDASDNPIGFVGVVRDITERKKMEHALQEAHDRWRARTVELSESNKLLRREINERTEAKKAIRESKERFERLFRDARTRIIVEGQPGYVGLYKDISQLKRAEKTLKETMKKLATMNEKLLVAGSLTRHDVRNRLLAIAGNIFLAKRELVDNHEALEYLEGIETAIEQIKSIFDFARIYERLGVEELAHINVGKCFGEAISLFPNLHDVKVVNNCHGLTVMADSLLRQLFYNLIDNSLRYGEKVSQIGVHYEETGKDRIKLIYDDDGVGISKAEKEKIFIDGYGKNAGYGLYLIRKICEVHAWSIRETGKEGKGAQFSMIIPRIGEKEKTN